MSHILHCLRILILTISPAIALAAPPFTGSELDSGHMTVVDEQNVIILQTGLAVYPGDQYIAENNKLYEVITVEGTLARSRFLRNEPQSRFDDWTIPVQAPPATQPPTPPAAAAQLIAIYYTHDDESYTPSDGNAAITGDGGILKVGAALAQRLSELGYQTENDQTLHDPHDANAYQRSRRTFTRLLEHQPAALFDIHRDSAPRSVYQTVINGQEAVKILLVVGRQNQNRQTTMDYAKSIKTAADSKYQGLVRGIFIAHGNYNQDLNPRAMLLEIGTQYNSREASEYSATLFADLVPLFLTDNVGSTVSNTPYAPSARSYTRDILALVGVLVIGVAVYLYLSTGSWREAKSKLAKFRKVEFANFLGPRGKRKE